MSETKSEVTLCVDYRLLAWIRDRVAETLERGSIYIQIEKGRLTWINYEKNCKFPLLPSTSSSEGPKSLSSCGS